VYEYDGDGMRVRAGHDSGQGNVWDTRFYYDTGAPLYSYLFESDNAKNMTGAYTIDPAGGLISQRRGGSTYYHLYDQLGSTRLLTDASQTVTDTYDYYAFGEVQSSSGSTTNPFKFVGRLGYYDDPSADLQYLRARYYAPAYGRFLSADPVGSAQPGYAYCRNGPSVRIDPSGQLGGPLPICYDVVLYHFVRLWKQKVDDKFKHCVLGCLIDRYCGHDWVDDFAAIKEFLDLLGLGTPDVGDIVATMIGGTCPWVVWRPKEVCVCFLGKCKRVIVPVPVPITCEVCCAHLMGMPP